MPEASLPQPNDQAALAAGGASAGRLACVAIKAAGAIDAPDQAAAALARLQQLTEFWAQGALLAQAKEGIEPQGWIAGIRRRFQLRNAQPLGVAQVLGCEWFVGVKRAPDPHGNPAQMQFTGHHQAITAVVAGAHQHQQPVALEIGVLQHGLGQSQAGLLHQCRHRQPLGKEGCFQLLHGAAAEQQVLEVGGGPGHAFRMEGRMRE